MSAKFTQEYEVIVAVNTFAMLYRFDVLNGVYANSPNMLDFDGSATGYWERRAHYFGASLAELEQVRRDINYEVAEQKRTKVPKG